MEILDSSFHTLKSGKKARLFLRHLLLGLFIANASPSFAQSGAGSSLWQQRAAQREASRWTLQEWLAQKDRNAMMDLWLAFNQSSPYEFALSLDHHSLNKESSTSGTTTQLTDKTLYSGKLSAYASIFGLEYEYSRNTPENFTDSLGSIHLRLLGTSQQNTHLTVFYGLRTRSYNDYSPVRRQAQTFAGGQLQVYLSKYFGLFGDYRHFYNDDVDTLGAVEGSFNEGGLFIDFGFVRIFGNMYLEKEKQIAPITSTETNVKRSGVRSGIKIFF